VITLFRARGDLLFHIRVWLACFAFTTSVAVQAEVPSSDASAIRAVIEAQLDAFKADDAPRAFSYAAPGIQALFGTPAKFLAMVQSEYRVVYHPASVAFLSVQEIDGQVSQVVQMSDTAGALWMAVYTLERQKDGSWRISGCALFHGTGRSI
jgi:ketosteroid isomerase-like protein